MSIQTIIIERKPLEEYKSFSNRYEKEINTIKRNNKNKRITYGKIGGSIKGVKSGGCTHIVLKIWT